MQCGYVVTDDVYCIIDTFYTKHCFHAHNNGTVEGIPIDRDRVGKNVDCLPSRRILPDRRPKML